MDPIRDLPTELSDDAARTSPDRTGAESETSESLSGRDRLFLRLVSVAAPALLAALCATLRWRPISLGPHAAAAKLFHQPGKIIVFWHSQQLLMPWIFRRMRASKREKIYVLISQHRDGRMIAVTCKRLGLDSIAGSSSRGGRSAMLRLIRMLRKNAHVAVTPDGPRGPVEEVKPGIIRLAEHSGAEIWPVAFVCSKPWRARSWDRMVIPKPFSKARFYVGNPLSVPRGVNEETVAAYGEQVRSELARLMEYGTKDLL